MEYLSQFQKESLEKRIEQSTRIKRMYSPRIPVVIDRYHIITPNIVKHKYLVQPDMTIVHLLYLIRPQIKIKDSDALFLFHENQLIPTQTKLSELKTTDGFIYIIYSLENSFGNELI